MACISSSEIRFVKVLSRVDAVVDSLEIPTTFSAKYGSKLSESVKVYVGDSYQAFLNFNRHSQMFHGMKKISHDFNLRGGETLLFEFSSFRSLKLSILGTDEMELFYPKLIKPNAACLCPLDRACRGGLKFVKFLTFMKKDADAIEPPESFVEAFGSVLRRGLKYCLCNGEEITGFYDYSKNKLRGFLEVCELFGVVDLSSFDTLVFTYDGRRKLYLSFFDMNHMEIVPPKEEGMKFEVVIKPFHLYEYSYGVDIPTKFKEVTVNFGEDDYVKVFHGEDFWMLRIRKRKDLKRTTINDGWIKFRNDLRLCLGDTCVFQKVGVDDNVFRVKVVKSNLN